MGLYCFVLYCMRVFAETCYKLKLRIEMFGLKLVTPKNRLRELVSNLSAKYIKMSQFCQ